MKTMNLLRSLFPWQHRIVLMMLLLSRQAGLGRITAQIGVPWLVTKGGLTLCREGRRKRRRWLEELPLWRKPQPTLTTEFCNIDLNGWRGRKPSGLWISKQWIIWAKSKAIQTELNMASQWCTSPVCLSLYMRAQQTTLQKPPHVTLLICSI